MKKIFRELKAVIFDLDGVIVNTMPFHAKAWQNTFKKFGIRVTKKEIYLREGEKWDKTFYDILTKHRIKITKEIKKEVFKHRENVFKNILKIRIFKDAPPLIKHLKESGLKLALVTGTPRKEVKRILPKAIYSSFDVIIPSDEVRHGKPHPEPFKKALRGLKTRPSEAIVIENAPNGIKAAKGAGLRVIAVETSLSRQYLKGADIILTSLGKLNDAINACVRPAIRKR